MILKKDYLYTDTIYPSRLPSKEDPSSVRIILVTSVNGLRFKADKLEYSVWEKDAYYSGTYIYTKDSTNRTIKEIGHKDDYPEYFLWTLYL